jgi:hypothetical protein
MTTQADQEHVEYLLKRLASDDPRIRANTLKSSRSHCFDARRHRRRRSRAFPLGRSILRSQKHGGPRRRPQGEASSATFEQRRLARGRSARHQRIHGDRRSRRISVGEKGPRRNRCHPYSREGAWATACALLGAVVGSEESARRDGRWQNRRLLGRFQIVRRGHRWKLSSGPLLRPVQSLDMATRPHRDDILEQIRALPIEDRDYIAAALMREADEQRWRSASREDLAEIVQRATAALVDRSRGFSQGEAVARALSAVDAIRARKP